MYPIHYASIVGNKEIIEIILSKSYDEINKLTEPFRVSSSAFYTPLHIAASNENLQAVLTLLIHKAKANDIENQNKNNALHCSMRNTDLRIAEVLISYDMGLLLKENKNGKRPLDLAILFHNEPMCNFLRDVLNSPDKFIYPFESLYLKYSDTKNIDEKQKVTDQVVLLLSEKIESGDTNNHKDDGEEEEEEEEGQFMDNPNNM